MNDKDLERQTRLEALQEQHRILSAEKRTIKKALKKDSDKLGELNKQLHRLGGQIFDLKNIDGDTPHITDHAVVRFLERVKGMDIWSIKAEIVQHRDSVRIDNTIVTVNGDKE